MSSIIGFLVVLGRAKHLLVLRPQFSNTLRPFVITGITSLGFLPVVGMAKSNYEYARGAQLKGETEEHAAARRAVVETFLMRAGSSTWPTPC